MNLTREERQLIAELELVSNGTTQSYNPVGTKTGFTGSAPPSTDAPHTKCKQALEQAGDDMLKRADILDWYRDELSSLRKGQGHKGMSDEQLASEDEKQMRKLHLLRWSVDDIARAFHTTPTRVRTVIAGIEHPDASVHDLAARGLSVRNIALMTGKSKSEVQRQLRNAA